MRLLPVALAAALLCVASLTGACLSVPCSPETCPEGCCDGDKCMVASSLYLDEYCGAGGTACTDCTVKGGTCSKGACLGACGPHNCRGCCDGDYCWTYSADDDDRCGLGGVACRECGYGRVCDDGQCINCRGEGQSCSTSSNQCCSGLYCSSYGSCR